MNSEVFRTLYNNHPEYVEVRRQEGKIYNKYVNDVKYWKLKYIEKLVVKAGLTNEIQKVAEVGCATGVLLSHFFSSMKLTKVGIDVSDRNIESARQYNPNIDFYSGTLEEYLSNNAPYGFNFDLLIMSDVLEHVEDDVKLLMEAGSHSRYVIINLPIEKVAEYKDRIYGIDDIEGHLRAYSMDDAFEMCNRANMEVMMYFSKQYVKQPVFRRYLLHKLLDKYQDKADALIKYQDELIDIDINSESYKKNFFALLRKKN